jgi:hypothetical protein
VPRDLWLHWAGTTRHVLVRRGPLDEIRFAEYRLGHINADTLTVMQAPIVADGPEEIAGRIAYRVPGTDDYPPGAVSLDPERDEAGAALPTAIRRELIEEFGYCPRASELREVSDADGLDLPCARASKKEATWGELLDRILRHDFTEVIRWCEEEIDRPPRDTAAAQRFYLSREMVLHMVEHTEQGKVLLTWEHRDADADANVREARKLLDPFSGVH